MVTRKPVGPPLSTSPKANNATTNPPYPTTPTTTGLDRAKTLHSAKSVYSPDLKSSPAFDLIDMNEARQRPRRDSDVSSHGTWDSEDEGETRDTPVEAEVPKPLRIRPSHQDIQQQQDKEALPSILRPGPADGVAQQTRRSHESQRHDEESRANPWASGAVEQQRDGQAASHNPYRQQNGLALETSQAAWQDMSSTPAAPANAPPAPPVELPTMHTPAEELSRMSLGEQRASVEEKPFETAEVLAVPQQGRSPLAPVTEQSQGEDQDFFSNNPWRRPSQEQNEAVAPPPGSPLQAPLQPEQPRYAPPPGPPPKAVASTSLIDHEGYPQYPSTHAQAAQEPHRPAPISTSRPSASQATDSTPETPQTRATRQRSEHYQIKHVNWYDASYSSDPRFKSAMRRSPILTQNANGPCPLLALVNALVLSTPQNLETALIETLRTREQVSLGLLLDAVFDELTSGRRGNTRHELPDVGELYAFLLALHTGMNVNPRFVTPTSAPRGSLDNSPADKMAVHPVERAQAKAGCFEETKEMRLYSTFNIPLIHGWTAPKDTPAYMAFERSAQTFEDAQNIQFMESELEDKMQSEGLGAEEEQALQDIGTIKSFLNTWPTQLTDYGLETISASLKPGQIAILFRNDHFSTVYKEPKHGALMTLVTDAGYSSHEEIVWESLVDVNGAASEMFSGDFRGVSHGPEVGGRLNENSSAGGEEGWQTVQGRNRYQDQQSQQTRTEGPLRVTTGTATNGLDTPPPLPGPRPSSRQDAGTLAAAAAVGGASLSVPTEPLQRTASEQEDHDLALALQLQEEEEDHHRQAEQRRRREQELSERYLSTESVSPEGPRPPIPPRRSGNQQRTSQAPTGGRPPVTRRPEDQAAGADAPPTYEQSASDRPYRPAGSTATGGTQQGNPLNAYDALRRQQSAYAQQSSTTINSTSTGGGSTGPAAGRPGSYAAQGRRRSDGNRIRRRSSQVVPGSPVAGQQQQVMPGGFGHVAPGGGMATGAGGGRPGVNQAAGLRDAEERCVVM
ncbi:hypothetical protein LTR36_009902 [Oleoguttula mirabilis]|uniref:MINDY deubiquitinase domain-containing protein n=1 Tax=Oleoguttula mirabilis TaxID=1507867 RepID=A0AAV9J5U5_9PEZI|nr:hypothetical protein LTR36_009902 [Oleoguttula mirabilis]